MKRMIASVVLGVFLGSANAATVILNDDIALAIKGYEFDGQFYDIEFVRDSFHNIYPNGIIHDLNTDIGNDIVDLLLVSGATGVISADLPSRGNTGVARNYLPITDEAVIFAITNLPQGGWNANNSSLRFPATNVYNYAVVSAVPIPATAYLFASALGILGWMRRRKQ